jgi:hypothetical protein
LDVAVWDGQLASYFSHSDDGEDMRNIDPFVAVLSDSSVSYRKPSVYGFEPENRDTEKVSVLRRKLLRPDGGRACWMNAKYCLSLELDENHRPRGHGVHQLHKVYLDDHYLVLHTITNDIRVWSFDSDLVGPPGVADCEEPTDAGL